MLGLPSFGWLLLVAALFFTTNGLQGSQPKRKRSNITLDQTINVYAFAQDKLQWEYPQLLNMDCYAADPKLLAEAVEFVLHRILKNRTNDNEEYSKIECTFAAQVVAGLKYLLVDDEIPMVHAKVTSLLHLSVAKSASFGVSKIMEGIVRYNNISAFVDLLYMPGLELINEFAQYLDQTSIAVNLYNDLEDMIYLTYIKHLTANQFVIEIVVFMYDWIERHSPKNPSHTHVVCRDIVTKLDDKMQGQIKEIEKDFTVDQLKSKIEESFGHSFMDQELLLTKFLNFTLINIEVLKVPVKLLEEIHATMENITHDTTEGIRIVNSKVLEIVLGKLIDSTRGEYDVEKVMFELETSSHIPMDTPVLEVRLLDLEQIFAGLTKPLFNLSSTTCIDYKLIGILPGLTEVRSFVFNLRNVHIQHLVQEVKNLLHQSNPLSRAQKEHIDRKTEEFLAEFYMSKMKIFILKIEELLHGTLPTETILMDILAKLWESKPTSLKQLLSQSVTQMYNAFTEEVLCINTGLLELHASGTKLIQEFLKSLEISKEDIPEQFYSSIFCDNYTKPGVEHYLITDSQLEIAHLVEDIHLLMVDLNNCSSEMCYRHGYQKFLSEKLALMMYRHIHIYAEYVPPPGFNVEDEPEAEIDRNLMAVFIWQHNVIQNFTTEYLDQFYSFIEDVDLGELTMNMCEYDPSFCTIAIDPLK